MMGRLTELTKRFKSAAESHRWIKDRIANGDQFNCYERQSNDDDMADDEREYRLGIGPISNFAYMFDIEGQDMAEMIESALKIAALVAFPTTTQEGQ